jgi:hypothetical protein
MEIVEISLNWRLHALSFTERWLENQSNYHAPIRQPAAFGTSASGLTRGRQLDLRVYRARPVEPKGQGLSDWRCGRNAFKDAISLDKEGASVQAL